MKYDIEVTDTFGGEANYCWVRRFSVQAKSPIGAIRIASRETGFSFRKDADFGDCVRYNAKNVAVCAFITEAS
jgi:hypothetical protein